MCSVFGRRYSSDIPCVYQYLNVICQAQTFLLCIDSNSSGDKGRACVNLSYVPLFGMAIECEIVPVCHHVKSTRGSSRWNPQLVQSQCIEVDASEIMRRPSCIKYFQDSVRTLQIVREAREEYIATSTLNLVSFVIPVLSTGSSKMCGIPMLPRPTRRHGMISPLLSGQHEDHGS